MSKRQAHTVGLQLEVVIKEYQTNQRTTHARAKLSFGNTLVCHEVTQANAAS